MSRPGTFGRRSRCAGLVCASVLALGVPGVAQEVSDGVERERRVARELVRLDRRLDLATFPDGTGRWIARLAAALEHRGFDRPALELRQLGFTRDLDRSRDDLDGGVEAPGPERVERLERWLAALDGLETVPDGGSTPSTNQVSGGTTGVSGIVTRRATGEPVGGVRVTLYGRQWLSFTDLVSTVTTPNGRYRIETDDGRFVDDDYWVVATAEPFVAQLYDGFDCPFVGCVFLQGGTKVPGPGSGEVADIDFTLTPAGSVSGRVTDQTTGAGIEAFVYLYSASGELLTSVPSDTSGFYTIPSVPAGGYRATAEGTHHREEIYDALPCDGSCDPTTGSEIRVVAGRDTSAVDFSLLRQAGISGTVTEEATGDPVAAGRLFVHRLDGRWNETLYTEDDGSYLTGPLPEGTYAVEASVFGYADELWDDLACTYPCDESLGDPIQVTAGAVTPGIDFALRREGRIFGRVVEEGTGEPLAGVSVSAREIAPGNWHRSARTENDGTYVLENLRPGTYQVRTRVDTHRDEIWDESAFCTRRDVCGPGTGDPIEIVFDQTVRNVDFSLDRLGRIAATLRRNAPWAPPSFSVRLYDETGRGAGIHYGPPDGSFLSGPLDPGTYHLVADAPTYRTELYDDIWCPYFLCDLSVGTPVTVRLAEVTGGVEIALDRLGVIEGRVTAADTGEPLRGIVWALDAGGAYHAGDEIDAFDDGSYQLRGVFPGEYRLRMSHQDTVRYPGHQYQDELYGGVPCEPTCDLEQGQVVSVRLNQVDSGVDFVLEPCPHDTVRDVTGTLVGAPEEVAACELVSTSDGTVVRSGADVTFRTGRSVVLGDGFVVEDGGSFRVEIVPEWSDGNP